MQKLLSSTYVSDMTLKLIVRWITIQRHSATKSRWRSGDTSSSTLTHLLLSNAVILFVTSSTAERTRFNAGLWSSQPKWVTKSSMDFETKQSLTAADADRFAVSKQQMTGSKKTIPYKYYVFAMLFLLIQCHQWYLIKEGINVFLTSYPNKTSRINCFHLWNS